METERKVQMSRGTRRLFSRAFGIGVDPIHIKAEAQRIILLAQTSGKERVTRGDLGDLKSVVAPLLTEKRLEELRSRIHWDPTDSSL